MPKKTRRYPTSKKTTTKQGKRDYQRHYMRDRRASEAELRRALESDSEALKQLMKIPKAYQLVFGKKKGKRRR